jgi:ribosomal protein S18 acetylase RimI-like enzyme
MAIIRRAERDDGAALARLAERTFRDTFGSVNDPADMDAHCSRNFGSEIQLREIENPDLVTLLVEDEGELIAFAQIRLRSAIECVSAEYSSELYRLYVLSRWHGLGIAHELMKEVLDTVKRVGSDHIWLGVWERNDRALAFYRKFGFRGVGDHVFQLGRDSQRDLVMVLKVRAAADYIPATWPRDE